MTKEKIKEAISEAKRFIKLASNCLESESKNPGLLYGSKESGSTRRSSMDLTRKLAEMRKP